jgi:hypothetical protein
MATEASATCPMSAQMFANWSTRSCDKITVGVPGIGPGLQDPQPCVLPLYDTPYPVFSLSPALPESLSESGLCYICINQPMPLNLNQQGHTAPPIKITEDKKVKNGWHFLVVIGGSTDPSHYYVTVEENYWRTLTHEEASPQELVRRSFEFLLEREPRESILTQFNLSAINEYFPEYETTMRGTFEKQ